MRLLQLLQRFALLRTAWGRLPGWAKFIIIVLALPGLAAILLSILALFVSVLALLICTVPVYRLLRMIAGGEEMAPAVSLEGPVFVEATTAPASAQQVVEAVRPPQGSSPGRRPVEVRIIDETS